MSLVWHHHRDIKKYRKDRSRFRTTKEKIATRGVYMLTIKVNGIEKAPRSKLNKP